MRRSLLHVGSRLLIWLAVQTAETVMDSELFQHAFGDLNAH